MRPPQAHARRAGQVAVGEQERLDRAVDRQTQSGCVPPPARKGHFGRGPWAYGLRAFSHLERNGLRQNATLKEDNARMDVLHVKLRPIRVARAAHQSGASCSHLVSPTRLEGFSRSGPQTPRKRAWKFSRLRGLGASPFSPDLRRASPASDTDDTDSDTEMTPRRWLNAELGVAAGPALETEAENNPAAKFRA